MKSRLKLGIWISLAAIVAGLFAAQTYATTQPVQGLAMSPPRTEFDVAPGATKNLIINVANYTKNTTNVQLDAEQFNVTDEQYHYSFDAGTDVSKWASFALSKLSLTANQNVDVPVTVTIPKNAEPGGYYISLFATSNVQASAVDVQAQQSVASLLYITVDGNATRTGSLKSISSPLFFDGTQHWNMRVANSGTVHYRSNYTAIVSNVFNGQKVAEADGSSLILPHTTRAINARIPAPKFIGIYKVTYTISLGDNPTVAWSYTLLFLPKQDDVPLMIVAIIIIGAIGYGIWKLIRLRHRRVRD